MSRSALYALESFSEEEGVDDLKASLRGLAVEGNADQRSRLLAMRALAVLRDHHAVETLLPALGEQSVLGEAAWRVLRMLTAKDFSNDQVEWKAWFEQHGARPRTEWLIESLDDPDPEIRAIASRDLARTAGRDFGYRVNMPSEDRRAIRERFRMWWSQENDPSSSG